MHRFEIVNFPKANLTLTSLAGGRRAIGQATSELVSMNCCQKSKSILKPICPPWGHGRDKIAKNGSVLLTQAKNKNQENQGKGSAPERTRTSDLLIRSQTTLLNSTAS